MHYGEDWKKVSEHVGSRSEKDCIARFIRLPFGEQFMGPKEDRMGFENDDDTTDEPGTDVSKRLRLSPLADASNPILAQVCIIAFYPECLCSMDTDTRIGIGRIRIRGYGNFLKNPIRGYVLLFF